MRSFRSFLAILVDPSVWIIALKSFGYLFSDVLVLLLYQLGQHNMQIKGKKA